MVPSEAYAHGQAPPARPDFVKGDRPKTNSQARVLRKKNTMKNQIQISEGLQSRSEQSVREAAKFIVILIQEREQVVTFSQEIKHIEAFAAVKRQHPTATAISAGFFLYDDGALWVGGHSDTLGLLSRSVDHALVLEFIGNPEPEFILIAGGDQ